MDAVLTSVRNNYFLSVALILGLVAERGFSPTPLVDAIVSGDRMVVKALIDDGDDVNQADEKGCLPLHAAVQRGHLGMVRDLLAARAKADALIYEGWAPIHFAAGYQRTEIADMLIRAGIDINRQDPVGGLTPLCIAIKTRNVLLIRRLIAAQVDVNCVDNLSFSALHIAVATGDKEIIRILLAAGADVNAIAKLPYFAIGRYVEITPLMLADTRCPDSEIPSMLRSRGATSSQSQIVLKHLLDGICAVLSKFELQPS